LREKQRPAEGADPGARPAGESEPGADLSMAHASASPCKKEKPPGGLSGGKGLPVGDRLPSRIGSRPPWP
jgi:hypothetical protein